MAVAIPHWVPLWCNGILAPWCELVYSGFFHEPRRFADGLNAFFNCVQAFPDRLGSHTLSGLNHFSRSFIDSLCVRGHGVSRSCASLFPLFYMIMMARLAKLQKTVKDTGLDALLVTHLPHIQYLINYSGSNGLLIVPAQGKPHFFTDFRYKAQVKTEVVGAKISIIDRDRTIPDTLVEKQLFSDYDHLGFEKNHISYSMYDFLRTKFRHVKLDPQTEVVEKLIMIKS
jgi:hypothetical protein